MRDDVVKLARDPRPLLGNRGARLLAALAHEQPLPLAPDPDHDAREKRGSQEEAEEKEAADVQAAPIPDHRRDHGGHHDDRAEDDRAAAEVGACRVEGDCHRQDHAHRIVVRNRIDRGGELERSELEKERQ